MGRRIPMDVKERIRDLLLRFESMGSERARDLYVSALDAQLGSPLNAPRHPEPALDIFSIVNSCLSRPGALSAFVKIVNSFYGDCYWTADLERLVAQIDPSGPLVAGRRIPLASEDGEYEPPSLVGALPPVWNVTARNPGFTGRDAVLMRLREHLVIRDRAWVQALHGLGGVGKTQLAIEYAHRFAADYALVWWIDAEQPDLIAEQLVELAIAANWVDAEAPIEHAVQITQRRLRGIGRWLMVFDNAVTGAAVRDWLPQGPGHVIITSRSASHAGVAEPTEVGVFLRSESVQFLLRHPVALSNADANRIAAALGDLPLALAQAAGVMVDTRMNATEYLAELANHAAEVLATPPPAGYQKSLASAIGVARRRIVETDLAAAQMLELCALLAPEPIPLAWFQAPGASLDQPLAEAAARPFTLRRTVGRLAEIGLAGVDENSVWLHRLTQAVVRDRMSPGHLRQRRREAESLITAARPTDEGRDPKTWPRWAELLPHLVFIDPSAGGEEIRVTACDTIFYLLMRGDCEIALRLADAWHRCWRERLGENDPHVLTVASHMAVAFRHGGDYEQALALDQDTLARRRIALGEDDMYTLRSAGNVALNLALLGDLTGALVVNKDTLARRRRAFGDDHPDTLGAAENLAANFHRLGKYEQARMLDEDTLTRRRRIQARGVDHPDTLSSANNLAADLRALGEYEKARVLDEDTLARRRRILGDDHPDTLTSAKHLVLDIEALDESCKKQRNET